MSKLTVDQIRTRKADYRSKIKEFRAQISELPTPALWDLRNTLAKDLHDLTDRVQILQSQLGIIKAEARRRDAPGPTVDVSEHAVLRYLERVQGINMSPIRKKIRDAIPPDAKRGDQFTVDGISYVISESGRVLTLYQDEREAPCPANSKPAI